MKERFQGETRKSPACFKFTELLQRGGAKSEGHEAPKDKYYLVFPQGLQGYAGQNL